MEQGEDEEVGEPGSKQGWRGRLESFISSECWKGNCHERTGRVLEDHNWRSKLEMVRNAREDVGDEVEHDIASVSGYCLRLLVEPQKRVGGLICEIVQQNKKRTSSCLVVA